MKTTLKSILLATAAILASPAFAQTEEAGHEPGWYIQPVVGQFTIDGFCDSDVVEGVIVSIRECEDSSISYGLHGGYEFNKFWGVEGGFLIVDGFDGIATATDLGRTITGVVESDISFINLGMRGKYPFGENFFVLGKGGFSFWKQTIDTQVLRFGTRNAEFISATTEEDGTDLYYGAGVGISSGQLGITLEYTFYNANEDASFISISGIYKF